MSIQEYKKEFIRLAKLMEREHGMDVRNVEVDCDEIIYNDNGEIEEKIFQVKIIC